MAAPITTSPKEDGRYSRSSYWDKVYRSEASEHKPSDDEEWIFNYVSLKNFLPLEDSSFVVDVGCGVSSLLSEIRCGGYKGRLLGLDFSEVGIKSAIDRYVDSNIEYVCADACELLSYTKSDTVDLIIDKTAIDSQLCAGASGRSNIMRYMLAVGRSLKEEGVFVWATFEGPEPYGWDIVNGTLIPGLTSSNDFHGLDWSLDIHVWQDQMFYPENPHLKPTLYIFKKVHKSPRFLGDDVSALDATTHYH